MTTIKLTLATKADRALELIKQGKSKIEIQDFVIVADGEMDTVLLTDGLDKKLQTFFEVLQGKEPEKPRTRKGRKKKEPKETTAPALEPPPSTPALQPPPTTPAPPPTTAPEAENSAAKKSKTKPADPASGAVLPPPVPSAPPDTTMPSMDFSPPITTAPSAPDTDMDIDPSSIDMSGLDSLPIN